MAGNNRMSILSWTEMGIQEIGEELFTLERDTLKKKKHIGNRMDKGGKGWWPCFFARK